MLRSSNSDIHYVVADNRQPLARKKRAISRSSSTKGSDSDSNVEGLSPKQKQQENEASPTSAAIPNQVNTTQPSQTDEDDEILVSEDEGDPLVFDTDIGELIRQTLPNAPSTTANPHLEEGQSEEEEGYQASVPDQKAPSKAFLSKELAIDTDYSSREQKRVS